MASPMLVTPLRTARTLTLALEGRLDITSAPVLGRALVLDDTDTLVLDLAGCDYVSSAGLREILTAYKRMAGAGGEMRVVNVCRDVQHVLEITGLSSMLQVRPKLREISLDGLEFLSAGVCGECFRLDRETIVKVYKDGIDPGIAEQEKRFAKAAFVLGIPTAISYDVVACGSRTGVVYEMLDAELFSRVIARAPDDLEPHARTLAEVLRAIHETKGDPAVFPDLKARFREYVAQMDFFLPAEDVALLQERLEALPDADTCVHFDLHTSNIMIRDGEPVIIDMGDLSIGSPLFDVGLLCTIYGLPEFGVCEMATKLPDPLGVRLLARTLDLYFAGRPPAERELFERNRWFLASLRLIYSITFLPAMRERFVVWIHDGLMPRIRAEAAGAGA